MSRIKRFGLKMTENAQKRTEIAQNIKTLALILTNDQPREYYSITGETENRSDRKEEEDGK